jgi:hypothetical protein
MIKNFVSKTLALSVFTALTLTSELSAQQDYVIDVTIDGLSNDTVYLAHYYGNKLYYADTAVTSATGKVIFPGQAFEKCGKHAIVMPGPKYFEFLAVAEDVVLTTKADDPTRYVKVIKSDENRVFYDYLGFIQKRRGLAAPYEATLTDSTAFPDEVDAARAFLTAMGSEVADEQQRILSSHPDKLFAKYLNMIIEPVIPEVPAQIVNKQELQYMVPRSLLGSRRL